MFLPQLHPATVVLPTGAPSLQGDKRLESKLCDITDWDNPSFQECGFSVMGGAPQPSFKHRKLWEFVKLVQALEAEQLLLGRSLGLSVAAGHERVLYYLARYVGHLVATDIYGDGTFQGVEATAEVLRNAKKFAPYSYPEERLQFLYMNALELNFSDNLFDFAFSLSSIEHFGGYAHASRAIGEMARVVRPGGMIVVATDCSLNGYSNNEVFTPLQIQQFAYEHPTLELIMPINWTVDEESLKSLVDVRRDDTTKIPHINLRSFGTIFTSVALIFKKKGISNSSYEERFYELERQVALHRAKPIPQQKKLSTLAYCMKRIKDKMRTLIYMIQEIVSGVKSCT